MEKKIAVILVGCGAKDGSEIRESLFTLLALEEQNIPYQIFSPDRDQFEVVDHTNSNKMNQKRNMFIEAARIARGNIKPLSLLNPDHFCGIILPGGFGLAKNISTYPTQGALGKVSEDISQLIEIFYDQKKPIGAICIAPAIVAMVLGKHTITITLGNDHDAIADIEKTGAQHQVTGRNDVVIDSKHKIVSTPAYMYADNTLPYIHEGIKKLVKSMQELM